MAFSAILVVTFTFMDPSSQVVALVILLFLSGFFSAAETAFLSISSASVRSMMSGKVFGAKMVHFLKERAQMTLITILVGVNIVNITASVMATKVAESYFNNDSVAMVVGVMTLLMLVFAEIIPKTVAQRFRRPIAVFSGAILYVLYFAMYPITFLFDKLTTIFFFLLGQKPHKQITEDELRAMIEIGHEEGEVEKQEREFLQNIFEFTDTTAEEVMTNRTAIQAFALTSSVEKALPRVIKSAHSRFPVYDSSLDKVVGYITARDLLEYHLHSKKPEAILKQETTVKQETTLADVKLHKCLFFPITQAIGHIFKAFQKNRTHMAVILDEYGNTAGLVTMENILEEIVGDIVDEKDREETRITKIGKHSFLLAGDAPLDEIFEFHAFPVSVETHKSVAFLILKELGAFPREGEKVLFDDERVEMVVEKMKGNKVDTVRMTVKG